MEKFEREVKTLFEYSRFEDVPEMKKVISEFVKDYPQYEKDSVVRERISFNELTGNEVKASAPKRPSAEKQKEAGKGL